jgi:hypothetical protein
VVPLATPVELTYSSSNSSSSGGASSASVAEGIQSYAFPWFKEECTKNVSTRQEFRIGGVVENGKNGLKALRHRIEPFSSAWKKTGKTV